MVVYIINRVLHPRRFRRAVERRVEILQDRRDRERDFRQKHPEPGSFDFVDEITWIIDGRYRRGHWGPAVEKAALAILAAEDSGNVIRMSEHRAAPEERMGA